MPKKRISGTDFEIYLYPTIRRNFPLNEGYEIFENMEIKVGRSLIRPDFIVVKRGKYYAVIDAKDKTSLEPKDIDQTLFYGSKTKARIGIIYIANDTKVPQTVRDYADSRGITIRKSIWRKT